MVFKPFFNWFALRLRISRLYKAAICGDNGLLCVADRAASLTFLSHHKPINGYGKSAVEVKTNSFDLVLEVPMRLLESTCF